MVDIGVLNTPGSNAVRVQVPPLVQVNKVNAVPGSTLPAQGTAGLESRSDVSSAEETARRGRKNLPTGELFVAKSHFPVLVNEIFSKWEYRVQSHSSHP